MHLVSLEDEDCCTALQYAVYEKSQKLAHEIIGTRPNYQISKRFSP